MEECRYRIAQDLRKSPIAVVHDGYATAANASWPSALRVVESVKMMDRTMAVADTQAIGSRNGGGDISLCMADRRFQRLALGKPGSNR